jgi:lipopolysaccharide biosynthesis protein
LDPNHQSGSSADECFEGSSLLKDSSFRWLKDSLDAVCKSNVWRSKKVDMSADEGWREGPKAFNLLFEKIFQVHTHNPDKGKPSLDLDKMTKVPFDTVILDLLMYEVS